MFRISLFFYFLLFQSAYLCYGQIDKNQLDTKKLSSFTCFSKKPLDSNPIFSFPSSKNRSTTTNVPVKFHIVRHSDGTGGLTSSDIAAELIKLNNHYLIGNIQFFECGPIEFINSDTYYDLEAFGSEDLSMTQSYDFQNVINIYFVETITISGSSDELCGYASMLPLNTGDFFVVANSCTLYNNLTICHEMGHYLSLEHTQGAGGDQELADGSNCATSGDYVCDTPADTYNNTPSLPVDNNCNYIGTALDANGQAYSPLIGNIMNARTYGYCWTSFTAGQMMRVNDCLENDRNYLQCSGVNSVNETKPSEQHVIIFVSSSHIVIKSELEFSEVKLYDLKGQLLAFPININSDNKQKEFDLNGLASGMYFVQIMLNNHNYVTKKIMLVY